MSAIWKAVAGAELNATRHHQAIAISIFFAFASCAYAHPAPCPTVQFRSVVSASLTPSPTTRLNLVRQHNGSYTAYETTNTAPYTLQSASRDFAEQLTSCSSLNRSSHRSPPPLDVPANPVGSPSQAQAVVKLQSGSYLVVTINPATAGIDAAVFDREMNTVSVTSYSVYSQGLALADLNGDGNPDIVSIASGGIKGSLELEVLLGTGGSGFQSPIEYTIPSNGPVSGSFAIGDLNGDNKPDIVVAMSSALTSFPTGSVATFLGIGDGTLRAGSSFALASQLDALTLADLNGDGNLDLAASGGRLATLGGGQIALALGNGDGSFAPASYLMCSPVNNLNSIAVGDMNGDGIPDLVTIGTILFGDGAGSYAARQDYAVPAQLTSASIILTDFNGDGRIDIVIAGGTPAFITGSVGSTLTVLLGLPDGTFFAPPATAVPVSSQPHDSITDFRAADFNGDGIPDLVYAGENEVGVMLGKGDGTFLSSFFSMPSPAGLGELATGDFNGDGNQDAVSLYNHLASPGIVAFYPGKGDGTFQPPVTLSLPPGPVTFAAGDFNRDGKLDLAVLFSTVNGGSMDAVILYFGNGDGSFSQGASYPAGPSAYWLIAGDLNNDGMLDLVISNSGAQTQGGNISTLLGKGDGTFVPELKSFPWRCLTMARRPVP